MPGAVICGTLQTLTIQGFFPPEHFNPVNSYLFDTLLNIKRFCQPSPPRYHNGGHCRRLEHVQHRAHHLISSGDEFGCRIVGGLEFDQVNHLLV